MNRQPSEYLVLVFSVDAYTFCVPALEIESVIMKPASAMTPVPGSPKAVAGVLAHRGQIVTVIDLYCKLGLPAPRNTASELLVIARMEDGLTAFRADNVSDVISSTDVQWYPVKVNTSFTAVDKLGTREDLFLMHTHFASLASMEDSPQQDSQFIRFAEALGLHPQKKIETAPLSTSRKEHQQAKLPYTNGQGEETRRASDIKHVPPASGTHCLSYMSERKYKEGQRVETGKPSTIVQPKTCRVTSPEKHDRPAPPITLKSRASKTIDTGKPASPLNTCIPLEKVPTRPKKAVGHGPHDKAHESGETISPPAGRNNWPKIVWIAAGILTSMLLLALLSGRWHGNGEGKDTFLAQATKHRETTWSSDNLSTALTLPEVGTTTVDQESESLNQGEDETSPTPDTAKKHHQELLRVETWDFTLTVERPVGMPPQTEAPPEDMHISNDEMLVHIVVKGDTLWDIAKSYLGNPMLYPELAELSRINDPHWIYPRDLIRIVRR